MNIKVDLTQNSYNISTNTSYLNLTLPISDNQKVLIITDTNIAKYYLKDLENALSSKYQVFSIKLKPGEQAKSINTAVNLYKKCLSLGLDRKSCIVALGGGVVGDLSGFVASTYLRGIAFVQVPTTLLAQVDASIGGKTGIDLESGKNLVGTFYQPKQVLIDVNFLKTLKPREYLNGIAEIIKYGVIKDKNLFNYLMAHSEKIINRDIKCLEYIVTTCAKIKADVVSLDEKESGLRRILNFGHTLGHAIETINNYKTIKHGEGVSLGMVFAARLSNALGYCNESVERDIREIAKRFKLPTDLKKEWNKKKLMKIMALDKKMEKEKINFVLPINIGNVVVKELTLEKIENIIRQQ